MQIKEINSSETLKLRNSILRPDLSLGECNYLGDEDSTTHHFGCLINGELVGIVSIYQRGNSAIVGNGYQIRAMANVESVRGKGVGIKLLHAAEKVARDAGANYIWANARVSAVGFYEKAGYKIVGSEFNIKGVGGHFLVVQPHA